MSDMWCKLKSYYLFCGVDKEDESIHLANTKLSELLQEINLT
jgi:CRISPR/Cas system-associated exonuclease Cas4 (RecB family)